MGINNSLPKEDSKKPFFFSTFSKGSEGLYVEAVNFEETSAYLKKYIYDYNEHNKKARINVVLFDFLIEFLLKVLRLIK